MVHACNHLTPDSKSFFAASFASFGLTKSADTKSPENFNCNTHKDS